MSDTAHVLGGVFDEKGLSQTLVAVALGLDPSRDMATHSVGILHASHN